MNIEALYNRYFMSVYRYLYAVSGDGHVAEELTQETFFKALQKIDNFRGECDIKVWLCQIGKNAYYDYLRKNRRLTVLDDENVGPNNRRMEIDFEERESAQKIHRILHQMKEPYKEVFSLRTFGELPFREISELFEKSESWAKMTYLRAKRKIQEEMEHEDYM